MAYFKHIGKIGGRPSFEWVSEIADPALSNPYPASGATLETATATAKDIALYESSKAAALERAKKEDAKAALDTLINGTKIKDPDVLAALLKIAEATGVK